MDDVPASPRAETAEAAAAHAPAAVADNDEWEYEYSTTETETHLITLDLSIPEFVHRDDEVIVHNTRGGFRSWLNPINLDAGDGVGVGLSVPAADKQAHKGVATDEPAELQVLDLHGEPIIAYRGMLFRGTWADTIGTEMLFADSTAASTAANTAANNKTQSELVGAASARIACTPVELHDYSAAARAETMKRARKRLGFVIPVANGATAQRQKQGAFLESLMALKHRRHEGDVVTVLAVDAKETGMAVEERTTQQQQQQQPPLERAKRTAVSNLDIGGLGQGQGQGEEGRGQVGTSPVRKRPRPEDS